jgi:succinyl-CoA synthetase alpha subunit
MAKPMVAYSAGFGTSPRKRLGRAGAIVDGSPGAAADEKVALEAAGILVAPAPADVVPLLRQRLERRRSQ